MDNLFDCPTPNPAEISLGNGFSVTLNSRRTVAYVFRSGTLFREVAFIRKGEFRLLLTDLVQYGAKKSWIASAFKISRQTLDNNIAIREKWGIEGLFDNKRPQQIGRKADVIREERKEKKALENLQSKSEPLPLPLSYHFDEDQTIDIEIDDQPYQEEHDWAQSRYVGHFVYIITLIHQWKWLTLTQGFFGNSYKILMVLVLMAAENIRSIESLKNIRSKEAGLLLGIGKLPSKPIVWEMFSAACAKNNAVKMMREYFSHQIRAGLVSVWLWAVDGHLLPYTGKEKVHHSFNTQRKMPVPGRTAQATTDAQGRVVDYCIEEGKGNMKNNIIEVAKRWRNAHGVDPIFIFDREGYSAEYFHRLISAEISFVTWQKHVDKQAVEGIDEAKFSTNFVCNNKEYSAFEEACKMKYVDNDGAQVKFELRKVFLWNKSSNRRVCCMGWTKDKDVTTQEMAECILTRWGASENTFKHLQQRHPLNYTPGFKFSESQQQTIANPEVKEIGASIKKTKRELNAAKAKLADVKESRNSDGTIRKNSKRERLSEEIRQKQEELDALKESLKRKPERVNVGDLENYRSFKEIDNEGKYLFDFALASVWNARKLMVNWMKDFFNNENEVVDLFYAITKCHGAIKVTPAEVLVSLEPLEQKGRRSAQDSLCKKLSALEATLPTGKVLRIGVGLHS